MKYYTIKESTEYLRKSEKTIRRWIKSGHLKAKKENGKFLISKRSLDARSGQESGQMTKGLSNQDGQIRDKNWSGVQSANLANTSEITKALQDILEEIRSSKDNAVVAYNDNPLIAELRQERDQLRGENSKLFTLLGQAQEKVQQLEQKVKMLEAPKEEKKKRSRRRWWFGGKD